jgi:hypothetical protein
MRANLETPKAFRFLPLLLPTPARLAKRKAFRQEPKLVSTRVRWLTKPPSMRPQMQERLARPKDCRFPLRQVQLVSL